MRMRIHRGVSRTVCLLAVLLLPAAAHAQASTSPPPLDAYGDDVFLLSTSLAPNVILLMDNSESMSHMEWHPGFDQTVISPTCAAFADGTEYIAANLIAALGAPPGSPSVTATICGNTRTIWDPARNDAKMPVAIYWGRYLNWYFSDESDPYVTEIQTAISSGPGCKGVIYPDVYRRTRFQAAKQVILDTLCVAETKNVRFGLAGFRQAADAAGKDPNGGFISVDLGRANPNHATELESGVKNALVNDLTYDGADETPLGEALFQVYSYWMSRDLADLPTSDQDGDAVFSTFPRYEYDKFGNWTSNTTAWFGDAMIFPCEKAFVVIVSDGLPSRDDFDADPVATAMGFAEFDDLIGDYHVDTIGEDAEEAPAAYGLLDERAFYLDDIAQYMYENDFRPDLAGDQTIDTYTVGFAADMETRAFLSRTAQVGNGLFFTAADGEELADQLVAALNHIIEKSASFTAASVPSARTSDGSDFYQSYFFPRGASAFWEGHVRSWHITGDGDIYDANDTCALDDPTPGECNSGPFKPDAVFFWDAAEQVPQPDETVTPGRKLYVSKSETFGSLPTTWVQSNIDAADLLVDAFTNPNQIPSDPTPNNPFYPDRGSRAFNEEGLADEIVAYVRGCFFGSGVADPTKVDSPTACVPRPATLGDIFHSNPVVVRSPNRLVFGDPSYNAFKTHYSTTYPRDRILYAGTNAGFLEAIHTGDWDTSQTPPNYDAGTGAEIFGFMPWEARLKIKNLPVDPATSRTHYVDGDPQSSDVWFYNPFDPSNGAKNVDGSEWRTILVGSMREGGHQYFALDITNPNGSPQPGGGAPLAYPGYLWEFPTEADATAGGGYFEWMGETWGKPIVTKLRLMVAGVGPVERWVVIVTAGYDPNGDPNPPDVTGLAAPTYNVADPAVDPDAKKGRAIFILDAMTGEVIAMKGYDPASGDAQEKMRYAIVGRPSVLDLNADGFADIIYFVDMGGQVFKWVISKPGEDCVNDGTCDSSQPNWPFKLFFTAPVGKISGTDFYKNLFFSPAAAYSGGQLWLAFGSGERRSLSFGGIGGDPDSNIKENNRYYVVSDPDPYERLATPLPALTEVDLMDLTSDQDGANVTGRGFYFRVGNGEKFVTNTEIFAGHVIAASFKPTTGGDPCTARGDGTLYVFDLRTGEGYFQDASSNPTRGLDIGAGLPTDPQVSVGAGGADNKVIIEKSGTDIEMIEEQNINVGGGLLYWRERF